MNNSKLEPLEWHTEQRRIQDLVPWNKNPRRMTEKQASDLRTSLERLNLMSIPVIDADNTIISGHQHMKIMQALGRGEEVIDVRVPNRKLTDDELKEANLRENKNLGEWDFDLLAENFEPCELEMVGFSEEELKDIFQMDAPGGLGGNGDPDAVPDPPAEPKAKLGDLYQLGRHRLLCGDSTKMEDVERLMGGEKADLFITDPPYGVSYADKNLFLNKIDKGNRNQKKIENDHLSSIDMKEIWVNSFKLAHNSCSDKSSYYIFSPQGGELMMMMMMSIIDAGWQLKHMLIWVKNNHVLGRCDYNYKHEPILFGWKEKGTHEFYGDATNTSVWEVDKPLKSDLHPTMKPILLMEKALENSSKKGDPILDLFGGSGSTLIACEKTNRRCFMMELDPTYIDIIISRWETFTGQQAVKL